MAALACLVAAWNDYCICDGEKIVWVDAHGKKVEAVHRGVVRCQPTRSKQQRLTQPARLLYFALLYSY